MSGSGGASVSVSGLTKSFPGSPSVLDGVDLSVGAGTSMVLLGPSGCGKTTLLRIIAGLERPDAGTVRVGDRELVGPGTFVTPDRRNIGMVFQDWALFSHLNVARNVGFGLPRPERRSSPRIDESLRMVDMETMSDREIDTLSGGQRQRVALARALAPRPEVLLLDEPFSNLDATLRSTLRTELRELLKDLSVTSIFVTHDQEEAFILGDRIAVMNQGRVVQSGTAVEIYESPVDKWVGDFVGESNLIAGTATVASSRTVDTPFGPVEMDRDITGPVDVLVRPERLILNRAGQADRSETVDPNRRNAGHGVMATVSSVEYLGHGTRYRLDWQGVELTAREVDSPRFTVGETVRAALREGTFRGFSKA